MKFSSLLTKSGLFVAAFSFVGCSSSTKATGNTADSGTSTAGCQTYCTAIIANCKGGTDPGTNQQYGGMDQCMASCAAFPVGSSSDQSGNSLGCRTYHANLAAGSAANALLHCPHAGPGGDGTCGDICENYCQLTDKFCVGTYKVYANHADCLATCNNTPEVAHFTISTAIQDSDQKACLLYHAQEASFDPTRCTDDLSKQTGGDAGTGGSVTCH